MKTDIKSVIHLYIGCDCEIQPFDIKYRAKFLGIDYPNVRVRTPGDLASTEYHNERIKFKLIVRRLSSMTEEERSEYELLSPPYFSGDERMKINAWGTAYLLSKGFWLFGDDAFDEGLVIEAK